MMRYRSNAAALVAALAVVACGDGGTNPGDGGGGDEAAERFEQLADSVEGEGWSPTAEALRHAAKIVRLAGSATAVTLTVDGEAREFHAVGEQIDFPSIVCSSADTVAGGPDGCEQVGVWSMRTLIAWEPERMAEVVRIVADLGSTEVQPGVPDVMTGLPTSSGPEDGGEPPPPETPDSAVGEFPGFLGEYLVDDAGIFFATSGTQSNDLAGPAGECTEAATTLDWARFECRAARFRFEFDMRVEMVRIDPLPTPAGGPAESHELAMPTTEIDGVQLEVLEWTPPPTPDSPDPPDPPPPPPVDSTTQG